MDKSKEWHSKQLNVVEHTMCLYAKDVALLPANGLYEPNIAPKTIEIANRCHVYLIGLVPVITTLSINEKNNAVHFDLRVGGIEYPDSMKFEIPPGYKFVKEDGIGYVRNTDGNTLPISGFNIMNFVSSRLHALTFEVLYVGQAFGKSGERSALDQLKEHSTLQKIAIQHKVPNGYRLELVLLGIEDGSQLIMEFNPFAKIKDNTIADERIKAGLNKLNNTSEIERVALYEAALIRYFQPQYNKQFKDSFPSTTLKILQDCYEKDFRAVVAEICFDSFPYKFFSRNVEVNRHHIAHFDLHDDDERKSFFSLGNN